MLGKNNLSQKPLVTFSRSSIKSARTYCVTVSYRSCTEEEEEEEADHLHSSEDRWLLSCSAPWETCLPHAGSHLSDLQPCGRCYTSLKSRTDSSQYLTILCIYLIFSTFYIYCVNDTMFVFIWRCFALYDSKRTLILIIIYNRCDNSYSQVPHKAPSGPCLSIIIYQTHMQILNSTPTEATCHNSRPRDSYLWLKATLNHTKVHRKSSTVLAK